MDEPFKLPQNSLGTLFWNKVPAGRQNNALEIGRNHRHKLSDLLTQSLLSTDRNDGQFHFVLRQR